MCFFVSVQVHSALLNPFRNPFALKPLQQHKSTSLKTHTFTHSWFKGFRIKTAIVCLTFTYAYKASLVPLSGISAYFAYVKDWLVIIRETFVSHLINDFFFALLTLNFFFNDYFFFFIQGLFCRYDLRIICISILRVVVLNCCCSLTLLRLGLLQTITITFSHSTHCVVHMVIHQRLFECWFYPLFSSLNMISTSLLSLSFGPFAMTYMQKFSVSLFVIFLEF